MTCFRWFVLIIFGSYVSVRAQTWDIQLTCPAGQWIRRSNLTLTCTLRKAAFPSKCVTSSSEKLEFTQNDPYGAVYERCSVNGFASCSPFPADQNGCRCVQSDANAYTFEYRFTANEDYEGSWQCSVGCFDGINYPLTSNTTNCRSTVAGVCYNVSCGNGTCYKSKNDPRGYICICQPGYIGEECTRRVPTDNDRCVNDGEWSLVEDFSVCTCPKNLYQGENCQDPSPVVAAIAIGVVGYSVLIVLIIWQVWGCWKGKTKCTIMCTTSKQQCCCCLEHKRVYCLAKTSDDQCHVFYTTPDGEPQPDYPGDVTNGMVLRTAPHATGAAVGRNKYDARLIAKCGECGKWRLLSVDVLGEDGLNSILQKQSWKCSMNPDKKYNDCRVDQDKSTNESKIKHDMEKRHQKKPDSLVGRAQEHLDKLVRGTETRNGEKYVPDGRDRNKHTRTENSISKNAAVGPAANLTTVREKSVSVSSDDNGQKPNPVTGRALPLPAPSRLPSVERNSAIEFSSPGPGPLPPIRK